MGKKRSLQAVSTPNRSVKVEIKDEIGDNEVLLARDRLKGVLRELLHHSDEGSSAEDSEGNNLHEYKMQMKKSAALFKSKQNNHHGRKMRRRGQLPMDPVFHHTYVMKLFDRSVDLAQFREDTPLYPICRAWMANQPRNPNLVPKIRSPSPEIAGAINNENIVNETNGEINDLFHMPAPLPREEVFPRNRVPSPIIRTKEELYLDYEGQNLKSRETLLKDHRAHWSAVRRKWHNQAHKNEQRFAQSASILATIFKRAQSEFE